MSRAQAIGVLLWVVLSAVLGLLILALLPESATPADMMAVGVFSSAAVMVMFHLLTRERGSGKE